MVQRSVRIGLATAALVLAASVLCGACVSSKTVTPKKPADRGIKFEHKLHGEQGIGCTDCHTLEDRHASMPGHDTCSTCHDINMDEPEPEACAFCHTSEGFEIQPRVALLTEELKFSHEAHEAQQIECSTCHPNPDTQVLPNKSLKPFCMDCHGQKSAELNQCSVCHSEITKETIPLHRAKVRIQHDAPQIWENVHGQESKVNPQYCALCHEDQTDCEDCHQKNPPSSHTVSFKRKTHGIRASWDRQSCATCHEENSCLRCHKHTAPTSHRAGWGGVVNSHCVSCHYPQEKTNCTVCHEDIDHRAAMPSPHTRGVYPANCRLCHPGGVPYRAPHPLNSTVRCTVCHQ